MNKILIILLIISGLIIFILGGGVGIFYQKQILASEQKKVENANLLVKQLSSKTIPSLVAYGIVTKVDGRNMSMAYNGDQITIQIKEDSQVSTFVTDSSGNSTRQDIDFNKIKEGDAVSVVLEISSDGRLLGNSILVIPVSQLEETSGKI